MKNVFCGGKIKWFNNINTKCINKKVETAFKYAVNFYNSHSRSLDNQRKCLFEMMKITGFDDTVCAKIQSPILSILMYQDTVDIANEVIQQQLRIVADNIRNHLLNIQPTIQSNVVKELPKIPVVKKSVKIDTIDSLVKKQIPKKGCYDLVDFSKKNLDYKDIDKLLYGKSRIKIDPKQDIYQGMLAKKGVTIVKLDMSNCNIDGDKYSSGGYPIGQAIFSGSSNLRFLQHLNLSNNKIKDHSIYAFGNNFAKTSPCLRSLDLSNNLLTDNGAQSLSWSFKKGSFYYLKHLDVSGNKITPKGEKDLVIALNSGKTKGFTVITLEKQSSLSGVKSFMKKAFSYYSGETKKYLDNQQITNEEVSKAALEVYGTNDWAHCKKFLSEGSFAVGMGVATKMAHPRIQQLLKLPDPRVKAAIVGGVFIDASIESMGSVDWKDAGYCIASINSTVSSYIFPTEEDVGFIGENGVIDESF